MGMLEGRSIIVTGGNSGIGRAVVDRFLQEGASVVGVSRRACQFQDFASNDRFVECIGDVSEYETSEAAVKLAQSSFGKLDCFVSNAGVWDFYKKIHKLTPKELEEGFDTLMAVNLRAPLFAAHAAYPALQETRGSLVVTGSNACFKGGGGGVLYTASKFGLQGMVRQLALEFAPDVRVNGVAPGATDTPLGGSSALGQDNKAMNANPDNIEAMGKHIPMQRVSKPEEHTGAYVFLASEKEASYMTGSIILSDGGLVA